MMYRKMIKIPALLLAFLTLGGGGCKKKAKTEAQGNEENTQDGESGGGGKDESFEALESRLMQAINAAKLKDTGKGKRLSNDRKKQGTETYSIVSLEDALFRNTKCQGKIGKAFKTAFDHIISKADRKTATVTNLKALITPAKKGAKLPDAEAKNVGGDKDFREKYHRYTIRKEDAIPGGTAEIESYTSVDAASKDQGTEQKNKDAYLALMYGCDATATASKVPLATTEALARTAILDSGFSSNNRRLLILNFLCALNEAVEKVSDNLVDALKKVDKKIDKSDTKVAAIIQPVADMAVESFVKDPKTDPTNLSDTEFAGKPVCTQEDMGDIIAFMRKDNNIIRPLLVNTSSSATIAAGIPDMEYDIRTGLPYLLEKYTRNSHANAGSWTGSPIVGLDTKVSVFDTGFAYPSGSSELLKAVQQLKADLEKEVKALVKQYNEAVAKKPATQTQATQTQATQ